MIGEPKPRPRGVRKKHTCRSRTRGPSHGCVLVRELSPPLLNAKAEPGSGGGPLEADPREVPVPAVQCPIPEPPLGPSALTT